MSFRLLLFAFRICVLGEYPKWIQI